jgi:hypothetical protein
MPFFDAFAETFAGDLAWNVGAARKYDTILNIAPTLAVFYHLLNYFALGYEVSNFAATVAALIGNSC